jgi:hypothetical protein
MRVSPTRLHLSDARVLPVLLPIDVRGRIPFGGPNEPENSLSHLQVKL